MGLRAPHCPVCHAVVQIKPGTSLQRCEYCGSPLQLPTQAPNAAPNVELAARLAMARAAMASNDREALATLGIRRRVWPIVAFSLIMVAAGLLPVIIGVVRASRAVRTAGSAAGLTVKGG